MEQGKQNTISVIVPVYNGQDYIVPCIESIVSQQVTDLQIIIINDGSLDNTAQICEKLQKEYSNIQVITMEDLGVSAARNAGLDKADGDYITFVDADDRLLPGTLLRLRKLALQTDSDIVGCGFAEWSEEADWDRLTAAQEKTDVKEISYTGPEFIDKGILNRDTRCWSKLYKRDSIAHIRFEEGMTIGEDMLFLLAAASGVGKITISDFPGYGYFQNPGGAMKRDFKDSYMDQITCWKLAAERIERIRPDLKYKVTGIVMISVMLTVGKIAELPGDMQAQHRDKLQVCRQQLKEAKKVPGAFAGLERGYRIKVKVFEIFPGFYVKAYHCWKNGKGRK